MTSYLTSDGVVYPSYRNCYLGNHYTYFGFLSVSSTTGLSYTGSAATTDGKLRLLIINPTVKPSQTVSPLQRPPFYKGRYYGFRRTVHTFTLISTSLQRSPLENSKSH